MAKGESIRDEIRNNREEGLNGKSFGYKAKYYIHYYKVPVIAIIVIAIFLISLIKTIVNSKDNALSLALINANQEVDYDAFIEEYAKLVELDDKHEMSVDASYVFMDSINNYQTEQKFFLATAAGNVDVVIGPEKYFDQYAAMGYMCDISWIMSEEELAGLGDLVHEVLVTSDDKTQIEMSGVKITDTDFLKDNGWYDGESEDVYFGFTVETKNSENAKEFLTYLLK